MKIFEQFFEISQFAFGSEIDLGLKWLEDFVMSEILRTSEVPANPPNPRTGPTSTSDATFQINNVKLYVLVVTLSTNNNIKILEKIKHGFKITVSRTKYRSEITTQPKNNSLDYLIDSTFSSNYSETTGSLWFYSKDEATNFNNIIKNTDDFKLFK